MPARVGLQMPFVFPQPVRILTLALAASCLTATAVDFRREVQPVLSEHCYHCHGVDEKTRKGGLRLDVREAALKGGKSDGPAITPGKPEESSILARMTAHDADEIMPPPKEKKPVTAAQIETLKKWIAEGAEYAGHWAFESPKIEARNPTNDKHPLDAMVEERLAKENLKLSPPAAPATLARRLWLDLTGLPPTPEEVEAFTADSIRNPQSAIRNLTDTLLQSPRHGEKWARVWLDAARYSDSNGYEKDLPREQWAWRDWVIAALNRDMPYDQFIIEQIAGDLLPGATQEQVIATGFLRNGMVNEEGAIVPEQFRIEGVFDRMDCVGKAVLGLTLQCAQCHTHKFDPITHDEYFGMFAFLNNAYEAQTWVYDEAQQKAVAKVRSGLTSIRDRLKKQTPDWQEKLAAWEKSVAAQQAEWQPLPPKKLMTVSGLNHPTRLEDESILTLGHPSSSSDHLIFAEPALDGVTGLRLEALTHRDLPHTGPGHSRHGIWAITELECHTQKPGEKDWQKVEMKNATADFSEPDHRIEPEWQTKADEKSERRVGPVAFLIDGDNQTAWRADRGPGRRNAPSVAVVQFATPLKAPAGTRMRLTVRMNHSGDGNGRGQRAIAMLGRMRFSTTRSPTPKTPAVDHAAQLAMQVPAEKRGADEHDALLTAWSRTLPEAKKLNDEAEALWKNWPAEPKTSVLHLAEREPEMARSTHLLERGVWNQPKHDVRPHVPAALHPLPAGDTADRLTFARWLVDERSPLTARVAVNRVWQTLFGTGLVETSEDFGTRAPTPEHHALLDWLAADFMRNGWSQKHLLRTIVTSSVYQQRSTLTPELREKDPNNRLLARGPRFRADAETVRDMALAISGLLHEQVGGPSIYPPVPQSVLDYNYNPPDYWHAPTDAQRYRRSLYHFRKRSMPDPVLQAFDAPNGDFSCARRTRSNTPLAALTSLNETLFVEAAQALAQRILREGGGSDESRIRRAYLLCTSRAPTAAETGAVLRLLEQNRARLRAGELKAGEIAFSPLTKPEALPPDATPNDIASWTLVARVLLNLDETLSKS
ncbi:MAG TPA: PSD1 and planctomycete cytochrome C domain-containing protein [Prosthecobacter sp.]|nr:PSD1 and planctomycete cytochrome C domain-containing protein [Prosthecobacter sp.]